MPFKKMNTKQIIELFIRGYRIGWRTKLDKPDSIRTKWVRLGVIYSFYS